jgi:hypothetical protein
MDASNASSSTKIVFIGDSFTFGAFVDEEDSYPAQIEQILQASNSAISAYNAGVPGYGTDQTYFYLTEHVLKNVSPDILVWGFHINDIEDNETAPIYAIHDEKLVRQPLFWHYLFLKLRIDNSPLPRVIKESLLLNLLLNKLKNAQTNNMDLSDSTYREYAQKKLRLQLDSVNELARENDFKLLFVLMPNQPLLSEQPGEWDTRNYQIISEVLDEYSNFVNIPEIINQNKPDVLGASSTSIDTDDLFLSFDVEPVSESWRHPTALGNMVLAETITTQLVKRNPDFFPMISNDSHNEQ